jgi:glycosyltransferase involved in cell wall biosynthesis
MKLSIIVPVFNEEKTILNVISSLEKLVVPAVTKEIIVVDDGSTDSTKDKIKKSKNIKAFFHSKNSGKGAAVKTGIKNATGEYIIIQDADLEYNPKYIEDLIKPILDKKTQVVYGTRLKRMPNLKGEEKTLQFLTHYFGNRFLSFITSLLYGQWITDMETGYKLFPKEALSGVRLNARGFELEPEITAKLMKKGYKVLEIPIRVKPRGYDEGKKINTLRDGLKAFFYLFKYRISD